MTLASCRGVFGGRHWGRAPDVCRHGLRWSSANWLHHRSRGPGWEWTGTSGTIEEESEQVTERLGKKMVQGNLTGDPRKVQTTAEQDLERGTDAAAVVLPHGLACSLQLRTSRDTSTPTSSARSRRWGSGPERASSRRPSARTSLRPGTWPPTPAIPGDATLYETRTTSAA
jgi:hypothetical protein